jgi:hypothetical protein
MFSKSLSASPTHTPGGVHLFGLVLLAAAGASTSLIFACATPFAAFAVLAAAIQPLRPALFTIAAVWVVNQAIGFGVLHYPRTLDAAAWGLMIALAAGAATVAAAQAFRRLESLGRFAVYPIALLVSYATYELCLLAVTPVLGGEGAFTLEIIGRLGFLNAIWLASLAALYEVGRAVRYRVTG